MRFRRSVQRSIGEIVLIFVGITLSLLFANWNERRLQMDKQDHLLDDFLAALALDKIYLLENLQYLEATRASIGIVLETFKTNGAYYDTLDVHFANAFGIYDFNPRVSPYETLKSSGIDLITNDSVRFGIIDLYERSYKTLAINGEIATRTFEQVLLPFNISRFDQFNPYDRMHPRNYNALKSDLDFHYILRTLIFYQDIQIRNHREALNSIDELMGKIRASE